MEAVIQTHQLTKSFNKTSVVNGISLHVRKGEIYGFLGLNGAGKTTTIRMLLGMIRPDSGASYLMGKQVTDGSLDVWARVGYMVETPYSYPELTVYENLEIVRRLRQFTKSRAIDGVMEKLHLTPYRDQKAKSLSLGNAQRLGLAKAMLHEPEVLILDEPTNGLDPAGIVEIRELLRDLAARHGVTIFLSSHLLGEVTKLATRIGIIHQGKLVQESDVSQLQHVLQKRLVVNTRDSETARLKLMEAGYPVRLSEEGALVITSGEAIASPDTIARLLVNNDLPPILLKVEEEDLETYFLRTIGNKGDA
ncbi:ABC transporter ATP-binding protein [Paenibacillus sp. SI8]|uniref:ABC transporter ATP-binding protein n=1 Tax=unclassified Paenibacillus TaxID=185978 RepID=UPI0034659CBC